jgi:hypothetical protein
MIKIVSCIFTNYSQFVFLIRFFFFFVHIAQYWNLPDYSLVCGLFDWFLLSEQADSGLQHLHKTTNKLYLIDMNILKSSGIYK